jgi:GAF domain-containing protein
LNTKEAYRSLLLQLKALVSEETSLIANLSNLTAAIKELLGYLWVGFYIVEDQELVLGPFQGPVACTRIAFGKGVCGTAWKDGNTLAVPNVHDFPGHIACSALSQSEIVVPVFIKGEVFAVLDVDSQELNAFGPEEIEFFEKVAGLITSYLDADKWKRHSF